MKKSLILMFILVTSNAMAANSSSLLISAFCSNIGTHTSVALGQSQKLGSILEQLKNDPNCSGLRTSTSTLLTSMTAFESLKENQTQYQQGAQELEFYQEQLNVEKSKLITLFQENYELNYPGAAQEDIDIALANYIPSSDLFISLQAKVNELKLNQFSTQLTNGFEIDEKKKLKESLKLVGANIDSVYSSLNSATACTNANESIAPSIISNLLGLTSKVMNGVAGTIIGLGSDLIASSDRLIKNIKYNHYSRKIETNEMKKALSCSFEGITNTYCKAKDTLELVDFNSKAKESQCINEDCKLLQRGISLLSKKINSLNSWINLVLSGASPRDASQVGPFRDATRLWAGFNITKQTLIGAINGAEYRASLPSSDARAEIRSLMETLATIVSDNTFNGTDNFGNRSSGPKAFARFFQDDPECGAWAYFFDPANDNNRVLNKQPAQETCSNFARNKFTATVPINELRKRVRILNDKTSKGISFIRQLVSEENTSNILMKYNSQDNIFKTSPKEFIAETLDYYSSFKGYLDRKEQDRPLLVRLINRGQNQLERVKEIIGFTKCEELSPPEDEENQPNQNQTTQDGQTGQTAQTVKPIKKKKVICDLEALKVLSLIRALAPSEQNLSVQNSLRPIFREHVEIAKADGDISDKQLLLILNSSSEDSSSILIQNELEKQNLIDDANEAMDITAGNLENFWKVFSRAIYKTTKELKSNNTRSSRYVLGKLCVRAALAPLDKSKRRKLKKYCSGAIYKSSNRRVKDIKFDDIINVRFEDKACTVYDFQRKLRLLNNQ